MVNIKRKRPKNRNMLPFSTLAENRHKDFTKDMEMAAVLYLAEANRKKSKYSHLKKREEKLVFLTKACYPIWLIPYNKTTLSFDGFGLVSHTFFYDTLPDIEVFNRDVQRCQKTTDSYIASLTRNMDYFRDFQDKEKIRIKGLIATPKLRKEIKNYLPEMKHAKKSFSSIVFLEPKMSKQETRIGIKELSLLKRKVDKDIEDIDASMKFLNSVTVQRIKAIKEEMEKIRETRRRQIKKTRVKSKEKLRKIRKQYNSKITGTSKKFKKRLIRLSKREIRLKRKLKSLMRKIGRCEIKIKASKRRHSKRYEDHWTKKLERFKKNIQSLRRDIKVNRRRTRDMERAQKSELAKQRRACCRRIQLANQAVRDRQGPREAEIVMKRQDIATVEEITRYITKLMQRMLQKKKLFLAEFENIAMSQGKRACRLVYIPFYLGRYEKEDQRRYVIYPPSIAGDMGVLAKMKGALGVAKVKTLIKPRSEAMTKFLNQLLEVFEKEPMFEKEVTETGIQKSTLLRKKLRVNIAKGLKKLENEKWISKKERQVFSKILFTYSTSMSVQLNTILISETSNLKCLST